MDTTSTDLHSRLNGRTSIDVLAQRPEMVILWAGYAFSKDYSTPRGHMYALQDIVHSLRTGAPMGGLTVLNLQVAGCVKVLMFPV